MKIHEKIKKLAETAKVKNKCTFPATLNEDIELYYEAPSWFKVMREGKITKNTSWKLSKEGRISFIEYLKLLKEQNQLLLQALKSIIEYGEYLEEQNTIDEAKEKMTQTEEIIKKIEKEIKEVETMDDFKSGDKA